MPQTPILRAPLVLVIAVLGVATAQPLGAPRPPDIPFRIQMLDGGANETAAVADINRDGRLDIVSGENWYEGPTSTPPRTERAAGTPLSAPPRPERAAGTPSSTPPRPERAAGTPGLIAECASAADAATRTSTYLKMVCIGKKWGAGGVRRTAPLPKKQRTLSRS
jgi:hypothetical protein